MEGSKRPSKLFWLHVLYIYLMLGGLLNMLFNGPSDFRDYVDDRSPLVNVAYLAIHIIYLALATRKFSSILFVSKYLYIPIIIAIFSFTSAFYSTTPERTIFLFLFQALQIIACAYILSDLSYRQFVDALGRACLIAALMSVAFALVIPSYGKMTYVFPGAWQGIFIHKNVLGKFATFALVAFLACKSIWPKIYFYTGILSALTLVLGSGSATAYLAIFSITCVMIASRSAIYLTMLFFGASTVLLAANEMNVDLLELVLSDIFGKSATASGRTTIWALSLSYISESPIGGYGLGAFWSTPQASTLRAITGWFVPHAHNGFLEVGLQLGWVGMLLYLAMLIKGTAGSITALTLPTSLRVWPILFIAHSWIYGLGEANYLRPNSITQVGLFAVLFYSAARWSDLRSLRSSKAAAPASELPQSADNGLSVE